MEKAIEKEREKKGDEGEEDYGKNEQRGERGEEKGRL